VNANAKSGCTPEKLPIMSFTADDIIKGLHSKDPLVFQHLYRTYGGMISGHVLKNSGSEEDAKELIQVVILDLWIAVKEGRYQEQGKLGHYVYQLAANSWREELRRRRNRPQTSIEDSTMQFVDEGENDLARAVVKDQYLDAIHQGINQLGEPCKEIIQLYHLQKVSLQDVAQKLQYDYDNLRKRIFDCRKKLKKIVEKQLEESGLSLEIN
jgi:RNA polymerase sigma factor (sigma-70 family)